MTMEFLTKIFQENEAQDAIIWRDNAYSYKWLLDRVRYWNSELNRTGIEAGSVVALDADFTPNSIALFLALTDRHSIVVPLTASVRLLKDEFLKISEAEILINVTDDDSVEFKTLSNHAQHDIYGTLRRRDHPGLVLFSSGSTGKNKAALHDLSLILEKFHTPRHRLRTITFLLFDHIGGVNTMLYQLSNGGTIVTTMDRHPDKVLSLIERFGVELLPASPSFLNLVILSDAIQRYDISSLKTITYGTEPMPESTLRRLHELLPTVNLLQTYGLSEVGILRSKSKAPDSLWVKIGGEGFETRVVDNLLEIKAKSAMLGYLNAPSPFTAGGWFQTGDRVEQDGEYFQILGRESEMINVGGEKVYPADVESVIQEMDNVADATVYGLKNPIMGQVPCAKVSLLCPEETRAFTRRLKSFCAKRLPRYKVPVKIEVSNELQHGARFKKMRKIEGHRQ